MSGLFEDISQFDEGVRIARRQAAAVATKRVSDRVGGYLRLAKSGEEYTARLDFVSNDIRQIVADVAEDFGTDQDKLLEAIDEHLKGDGVTELDEDLDSAPSAVGAGKQSSEGDKVCPTCNGSGFKDEHQDEGTCPTCHGAGSIAKQAAGHKDGCECGFCKNKGSFGKKDKDKASEEEVTKVKGILDDEEKNDKDASEPEWRENIKDSAIKEAFTAKDFVLLADAISKAPGTSPQLAEHFADTLAQTNPRFDRERFIAAASGSPLSGRDALPQQQVAPPQGPGGAQAAPAGQPPQPQMPLASIRQAGPLDEAQGYGGVAPQPHLQQQPGQLTPEEELLLQQQGQQPQVPPIPQYPGDPAQPQLQQPMMASTHQAEAPRDGGGATKIEKLPKGDGKAVGTGPSPKTDHKTWRPNALNPSTNTPPVDTEMSGTPVPTETQDVDTERDYEADFLRNTDAVTDHQDLPSANPDGFSKERNISQDGQDGTWSGTEGLVDPVTSPTLSSFLPDNQVESAIRSFKEKS
jgi:hypothetical protein